MSETKPQKNLLARTGSGFAKAAYYGSGLDVLLVQPIQSVLDSARPGADGIRTMVGRLIGRDSVKPLASEEADPAKRFEIAQLTYGRDQKDIAVGVDRTNKTANFYLLLWGLATAFALISTKAAFPGEGALNLMYHAAPFALPFALATAWSKFAFWNWQLRIRSLRSFGTWLASPGQWLTEATVPNPGQRRRINSLIALFFTAAMLAPALTYAASDANFEAIAKENGQGDYYIHMLALMFSGIGPIPAIDSNYATPLASAFNAFLSALMLLGAALLGWGTFAGTVATAHEGQVLGKRWHTIWAPTRVMIGFGALAPVVGGYCGAQILLLNMFVWGGGLANHVWKGYLNTFSPPAASSTASGPQLPFAVVEPSMKVMGTAFAKELAQKEVCRQTIHAAESATGNPIRVHGTLLSRFGSGDPAIRYDVPKAEKRPADAREIYVWDFGLVCGQVVLDPGPENKFTGADNFLTGNTVGKAQMADFKAAYQARVSAAATMANGIDGMMKPISEFATAWVDAVQPPYATNRDGKAPEPLPIDKIDPRLIQAVDGFVASQKSAMNNVYQAVAGQLGKPMTDVAKEAGWASASVFFNTIRNVQNAASEMSRFAPTATGGDLSLLPEDTREGLVSAQDGDPSRATLTALQMYYNKTMASAPDITATAVQAGAMDNDGIDGWLTGMVIDAMGSAIGAISPDPNMAMSDMIEFGHTLLWTFISIVAAWPIIVGLIEVAKLTSIGATVATTLTTFATGGATAPAAMGSAFAAGATSALSAMLVGPLAFMGKMFLFALWAAGMAHSVLLPMIPVLYWLYFLGGLLILAVEAMVAAPLWALSHIKMDGEDFAGAAKPGYMIAFNMLLRPSLALFGLILSSGVFGAIIWFLNKTFYPAALSAFAGHGIGIMGAMAMVLLLSFVHYQMAIRSFSLIAQVPDRVTRWFGQGGEQLGEEGHSEKATAFIMAAFNRFESIGRAAGTRAALADDAKQGNTDGTEAANGRNDRPTRTRG